MADEWITPAEAAKVLGVGEPVVYRLIDQGKLPALRWPVRLLRSDVLACLDACRVKPGELAHLNQYAGGRYRYAKARTKTNRS